MNKYLEWAPLGVYVILYRNNGRPPIIAGTFDGSWETWDGFIVEPENIIGWAKIPDYP